MTRSEDQGSKKFRRSAGLFLNTVSTTLESFGPILGQFSDR